MIRSLPSMTISYVNTGYEEGLNEKLLKAKRNQKEFHYSKIRSQNTTSFRVKASKGKSYLQNNLKDPNLLITDDFSFLKKIHHKGDQTQ